VTVKVLVRESVPSDTRTVMVYVPGPWLAEGVHEKTPFVVIEAPAGAPDSSVYVRVFAGSSESLATTVKVSCAPA